MLASSRAIMEAMVEPKRASTPRDTCLSHAQLLCTWDVSILPVVYLNEILVYITVRSTHTPQAGKGLAGL